MSAPLTPPGWRWLLPLAIDARARMEVLLLLPSLPEMPTLLPSLRLPWSAAADGTRRGAIAAGLPGWGRGGCWWRLVVVGDKVPPPNWLRSCWGVRSCLLGGADERCAVGGRGVISIGGIGLGLAITVRVG